MMENIFAILEKNNINVAEESKKEIENAFKENYKTINDYNMQSEKLKMAHESIKSTEQMFNDFKSKYENVDVDALKSQIDTLSGEITNTKNSYEEKIMDMSFNSKLSDFANKYKCRDLDALKTKFDIDNLKSSKNQDKEIENAFETAKGSYNYLFETSEPKPVASTNFINPISNSPANDMTVAMRQAIGLPTEK